MYKRLKFIMILMAVLFTSCQSTKERTLEFSDKMLMVNPERVLVILDSLENTGSLNNEEQLHLVWNRAMAHKILGMSLAEDEQLPYAIAFYRNDPDKQADSYLLEASYLNWTGKITDAINILDKGIAEITDSTKLVKLMAAQAGLFEHQKAYRNATEVLKRALEYNSSKREEAILNYKIGLNLSLMGNPKSEYFYEQSVRLATENGDMVMACEFMRNYADYLSNNGKYQRSNDIYYQIGKMMPEVSELSAIQMAMAGNYINLHKIDSARICNEKAIESEAKLEAKGFSDITRRVVIEMERCILDFENGKHVSYVDFSRYCDSITTDMQAKENTMARRQEAKERLQWVNNELKLERQRMMWILSVAILLLLLSIIMGYFYYKNRVQCLAEAEDRIDTLTRMLKEAQSVTEEVPNDKGQKAEDDAFIKKVLLQQLGIIRMVASTPSSQNQALLKRITGIGEGKIQTNSLIVWSDIYLVIDRLYDNFHTSLTEKYGHILTEKEIQISCLLCAGFSTKEIGVITQQSDATIYVRKTSIRKKVGASEGQDIVSYINDIRSH